MAIIQKHNHRGYTVYPSPPDPFEPVEEKTKSDPVAKKLHGEYFKESLDLNRDRAQLAKLPERVNHPSHYNQGKYEVIDVIQDWGLDFTEGNVVKYLARSKYKENRIEDLKKARWYLDYLINHLEKE